MYFIDANIILRYLMRDDEQKASACLRLFQQANINEIELTTSESVLAEVVYVMISKRQYNLTREYIRASLSPVLSMPGLKLVNKEVFTHALELFEKYTQLDFEDALTISHMKATGMSTLYSYDTDFDSIPGITRLEPGS